MAEILKTTVRDGVVDLIRTLPLPQSVSSEARAFLKQAPWGDGPPPKGAAWKGRARTDAMLKTLSDAALQAYPVSVEEVRIANVRCHLVRPLEAPERARKPVLINLHGGAFVLGSGVLAEAIPVAHRMRAPVIAVDYRLAPEHPYPAAVEDIIAVYREVLNYHPASDIALYGASAGGFLTGQAAVHLRAQGIPLPACLGIFTAGGDFADFGESASIFTLGGFEGELILPFDSADSEIKAYLGGADPADPLVSPIRADLSGMPPSLLLTGTRDALLSAACLFHRALRRAGADADLFVFEAMPHAHWYNFFLPESREALEIMAGFFQKHIGA